MHKFYAVATTTDNKQKVLSSIKSVRISAVNDILAQAKELNMFVDADNVQPVKGARKQDKTTTKFFKKRRVNGDNGRDFDKAL